MNSSSSILVPDPIVTNSIRLGFVTERDPGDVTGWSGINTFMSRALAEAGAEIVPLFGFKRTKPLVAVAKKAWAHFVHRRYYEVQRHPAAMRHNADQIESRVRSADVQALFSTGTHLTADCRTKFPLFFWADATVPALFALYPGYEKFWTVGYREALESEKRAVKNATAMFFSSEWAAESAINDLGADPRKVYVVPFGANFEREPIKTEALAAAAQRSRAKLVLLFAGVDWRRKGGDKALAVASELASQGVPVVLHMLGIDRSTAGCETADNADNLAVHWHGRISKATEEGARRIEALFSQAHFLLLPTVADCTPMVFAEANAYAVPVATHRVGGIPTMIRDGRNGRMFALNSPVSEQAGWMAAIWRDADFYLALAVSSREEYEQRLNWRNAAATVMAIVRANSCRSGK